METKLVLEVVKILVIFGVLMNIVPFLVYLERRICGLIQERLGPNRVGPFGILQPLADVIKLMFKQDIIPKNADKFLYIVAPLFVMVPACLSFAVITIGKDLHIFGEVISLQVANLHVGILFFFAIGSLSVYGITFGGWASGNKYSLFGGIRSSAQMISYEVAMSLAAISVLMSSGSVYLPEIVRSQQGTIWGILPNWNVFYQPLAFLIFLIAAFAETNRLPFDLPEAESELVAGYHTEYSSMKFAMFFMGEYLAMIAMSGLIVTLFFGGWTLPGVVDPSDTSVKSTLLSVLVFGGKTAFFLLLYIWVRWTLPRFRYDQLMRLGWKYLIPLGILNILVTGVLGLKGVV